MEEIQKPRWYHEASLFIGVIFLVNAIPHLIHGLSGKGFPTPFANPPGKGLSSPTVNVAWALANIVVGTLLVSAYNNKKKDKVAYAIVFIAFATASVLLSATFSKVFFDASIQKHSTAKTLVKTNNPKRGT